jgi:hypothetical protein
MIAVKGNLVARRLDTDSRLLDDLVIRKEYCMWRVRERERVRESESESESESERERERLTVNQCVRHQ